MGLPVGWAMMLEWIPILPKGNAPDYITCGAEQVKRTLRLRALLYSKPALFPVFFFNFYFIVQILCYT